MITLPSQEIAAGRDSAVREHISSDEFDSIEKSVQKLEQLIKVGTADELAQFLQSLSCGGAQSFACLMIQILAAVFRTVGAVSDREALAELLRGNTVYTRAAYYDTEAVVRHDIEATCMNARAIIARFRKENNALLCDRVMQIIEREYSDETLSLTGISERLYVSPNYLSAVIKKTKKANFTALVTEKRMKSAADMLVCTQLKIFEIAARCGYSDQHYFSHCFRKYYGMTPMQMRESRRSE